jgi:hypothetical protein
VLVRAATRVVIFKPNDIILAQILAILDFNNHEWNYARIFEAMLGASGDVCGLIAVEDFFFIIASDYGSPADHDPMFAAVVVHLETEPMSWLDFDPFDFVTATFF